MPIPDSPGLMSCRAYAKRRGVNAMTVSLAIRDGRLSKSIVRDAMGQPKIADPELADREWEANTDPVRVANALAGREPQISETRAVSAVDEPETTASATQRLKAAQADLKELELAKECGKLVNVLEVRHEWADLLSQCRSRLLAIPVRARQSIPSLSVAEVTIIEDLIREALEDLVAAEGEPA